MRSERQKQAAAELVEQVGFALDPRKCVHVKIPSELHAEMRVFGFKKKLSLQEMFIEFCQMVVNGDARVHKLLDDLAKRKKEKRIKKITMQDTEDIYDYIAQSSGNEK